MKLLTRFPEHYSLKYIVKKNNIPWAHWDPELVVIFHVLRWEFQHYIVQSFYLFRKYPGMSKQQEICNFFL